MCGLIAAFNTSNKKVNNIIINQYQDQYSRGVQGYGIIRISDTQKIEIDRACEATKFLLDLYMKDSNMIIAHHRHPTSTDNKMDQTHPMIISNKMLKKDYYIIHNGIVSNNKELKKKHEELGFKYETEYIEISKYKTTTTEKEKFNDSESIAIEIALFIEKKIDTIRLTNRAAFIILQVNKKTKKAEKVYFGKNESYTDLRIIKSKGHIEISSEGIGENVEENQLYSFKVKDKNMKLETKKIEFEKIPEPIITKTLKEIEAPKGTKKTEKEFNRGYREWIKDIKEEEEEMITSCIPNGYATGRCNELIQSLKNKSTYEITEKLGDTLDEEVQTIKEVLEEYRTLLTIDIMTKDDKDYYVEQIDKVMATMQSEANIAETKYKEEDLEEEMMEEEMRDYNSSFLADSSIEDKDFMENNTGYRGNSRMRF